MLVRLGGAEQSSQVHTVSGLLQRLCRWRSSASEGIPDGAPAGALVCVSDSRERPSTGLADQCGRAPTCTDRLAAGTPLTAPYRHCELPDTTLVSSQFRHRRRGLRVAAGHPRGHRRTRLSTIDFVLILRYPSNLFPLALFSPTIPFRRLALGESPGCLWGET
jgi:hypothetical protein